MLIETILAAFEMDEILYELREHAAGLNAGRWDYLFSSSRSSAARRPRSCPDRAQLTMTVAVHARLHRAAGRDLPPPRRPRDRRHGGVHPDPARRGGQRDALAKVREDKERESGDGFDGTWVAHPDLVPVATEIFDGVLGDRPNQKERLREDVAVSGAELLDSRVAGGAVTEAGVRANVSVALQYLDAWLGGNGAAAINNLMEDAATAEISRSQLWQWRTSAPGSTTAARPRPTSTAPIRDEELAALGGPSGAAGRSASGRRSSTGSSSTTNSPSS